MSDGYISLFDALDASLKSIINNYGEKWISTGDKSINSNKVSSMPLDIDEYFCKVFELQNHNYLEICICLSGSFAIQIDDQINDLAAGDVCLILPGAVHSELAKKHCSYESIWITIYLNTIKVHLSGRNFEKGLFYTTDGCSLKAINDCSIFTNKIKDEALDKGLYYYDAIKSIVIQILLLILRLINEQGVNKQDNKTWKESVVLQVKLFIEKNYSNTVRLNDVSQELCISPNYLNTIFKSVTGKTIIQYMEEYRIDKAKQLLKESMYSINEISEHLGYYDQYHFSKIFKKSTGSSPTQFKKQ